MLNWLRYATFYMWPTDYWFRNRLPSFWPNMGLNLNLFFYNVCVFELAYIYVTLYECSQYIVSCCLCWGPLIGKWMSWIVFSGIKVFNGLRHLSTYDHNYSGPTDIKTSEQMADYLQPRLLGVIAFFDSQLLNARIPLSDKRLVSG